MKKSVLKTLGSVFLLLVLFQTAQPVLAQSAVIKGRITSSDEGEGLPGVSILEKGTTNGTVTDLDGNYSLSVGSSSTLVISYIGYLTQEVQVGSRTDISVAMEPDIETLEEIVVIGYGTQKKATLSSAVASVNVENIQKLPGANVATLLQGQVPGVSANFGSGAPGAAPVVRVRGVATIGNNEPLYVIDGIPGDIASINPNDIESINVLKDASAATIYGTRASNGVIVITTKRGQSGTPVVSINSYVGVSSILKKIDVLNREQNNFVSAAAYAAENMTPLSYTQQAGTIDTDWQDEMFRSALEQKYDVGISGGNEFANYNFSVGYFDREGNVIGSDFERYNLRMNADFILSDRFKVGQTISYATSTRNKIGEDESDNNFGNSGFSPIMEILQSLPHNPVYDPNSPNGFAAAEVESGNVVGKTTLRTNQRQVERFQGNVYLEAKIIDGLKFRTQIGLNHTTQFQVDHSPTYNFGPQEANEMAWLNESHYRTSRWVFNNVLDFNKSFGDHNVSALIGVVAEEQEFRLTGGSNDEMPSNDLKALNDGIGNANAWGSNVSESLFSTFGQFNYAFEDKYLLQATIRRDGSSKFGPNNKHGLFYSASAGWRISSEDFFDASFISNLKPRFSIGKLGNQRIGDFQYIADLSSNQNQINYPIGDGESQTVSVGTILRTFADPDIKWEETTTWNVGLDLGLLDDQIQVTFDYFNAETTDMLVGIPIPATAGYNLVNDTNGGAMTNKGWEAAVTYKKVQGDFKFDMMANISHSKNEITQLGFADEAFTNGQVIFDTHPTTRTEVGRSIGEFYVYKTAGLFQNQGEIDAHGVQPNAQPGDLRFVDVNEDGELSDDDRTFVGSGLPDFEYGLTFNASYRNFDFSMFFQGSQGNEIYNGTKLLLYRNQNNIKNFSADLLDAWTPQNTDTSVPRVSMLNANGNDRPSDYFIEDGSYIRLRNVQVGYNFGNVDRLFSSARVYVAAENVFTITGYDGYDPGNTGYQKFSRGLDVGLYPLARNFIMGVQLKF